MVLSPVGLPARVLKSKFVQKSLEEKQKFSCFYKCLLTCDAGKANYCIALALLNSYKGDIDGGFAMCGANVYRVKEIVTVQELIDELVNEASTVL